MAITKSYGNDIDTHQGYAIAAGDTLTLRVVRYDLNAQAVPVGIGIEVSSAASRINVEVQRTDRGTPHWYPLSGNSDISADKIVSIDAPCSGIRISAEAATDGCGLELACDGATFERVTP